jgi:putative Mn2+ efflux pump MntP
MISVLLIGLSLAMDALAVSISSAITIPQLRSYHAVRASVFFGVFQFIMPVAGWFLGYTFSAYIEACDHWIAFGLLTLIGGRMIRESFIANRSPKKGTSGEAPQEGSRGRGGTGEPAGKRPPDIRNLGALFSLAIATSIDALAVGISFSVLDQDIWLSAAAIGGITFVVCLTGFEFGVRLRRKINFAFEKWSSGVGGGILVAIGLKILIEHLFLQG